MKTESFDNAGSILSHVASLQVMPCGLRKDGVVKTESGNLWIIEKEPNLLGLLQRAEAGSSPQNGVITGTKQENEVSIKNILVYYLFYLKNIIFAE